MPRQARPVVKDGRLVAPKKKRTDRSYLQPGAPSPDQAESIGEVEATTDEALPEASAAAAPTAAFVPPPPPVASAPAVAAAAPLPPSATARALQQQGVRKRREVDVNAVAKRDSAYAVHELRRIAILTAIVIVSLVVLTVVLR